jgi:arylsulfatase A-like enzyme
MKKTIFLIFATVLFFSVSRGLPADPRPNVLFITLDTTRADHLSCYGYKRRTTPNIDRLVEDSVLFENAVTVIPLTGPSHLSMMTGLHPGTHQVFANAVPVSKNFATMAEILRKDGYETAAFVSVWLVNPSIGFGQGFDYFSGIKEIRDKNSKDSEVRDERPRTQRPRGREAIRRGDKTVDAALEWFEKNKEKQFFAWVHLYDPHSPYAPPEDYGKKYNPHYEEYLSAIRNPDFDREAYADHPDPAQAFSGRPPARQKKSLSKLFEDLLGIESEFRLPERYPPGFAEQMIAAYDAEILFMDEQVERVFRFLKENDLYDNTIIIISGDHGEILHEKKNYFGHHKYLYNGSLNIPIIMKFPGIAPKEEEEIITNVDILPTLLEGLEIKNKMEMDGMSYFPLLSENVRIETPDYWISATHSGALPPRSKKRDKPAPVFVRRMKRNLNTVKIKRVLTFAFMRVYMEVYGKRRWQIDRHFTKFAVVKGDWKLIRSKMTMNKRDIQYELYNISVDPTEQHDLLNEEGEVAAELKLLLKKYIKQKRKPIIPEQMLGKPDREKREQLKSLKSLGYM